MVSKEWFLVGNGKKAHLLSTGAPKDHTGVMGCGLRGFLHSVDFGRGSQVEKCTKCLKIEKESSNA